MGRLRCDDRWMYNDCRVLRLENDLLCVDILPELGGKIYRLFDKRQQRERLWQHPRILPTRLPVGSHFDDNYAGGWDELFPTCEPCRHQGELYPDHGEYWTQACTWSLDRTSDTITLHLVAGGPVTPTRMERWITLRDTDASVTIRYRLTNLGAQPLDFLWSIHPAVAVAPGQQFIIPAASGIIASPGLGRLSEEADAFQWPMVPGRNGTMIDYRALPAETGPGYEMLYLTGLREGWYAIHDPQTASGFALTFDRKLFNTLWLFQSCGGWRGLHLAIIEPCTSYPTNLAVAAEQNRCACLQPGATLETMVTAIAYIQHQEVRHVAPNGEIT